MHHRKLQQGKTPIGSPRQKLSWKDPVRYSLIIFKYRCVDTTVEETSKK